MIYFLGFGYGNNKVALENYKEYNRLSTQRVLSNWDLDLIVTYLSVDENHIEVKNCTLGDFNNLASKGTVGFFEYDVKGYCLGRKKLQVPVRDNQLATLRNKFFIKDDKHGVIGYVANRTTSHTNAILIHARHPEDITYYLKNAVFEDKNMQYIKNSNAVLSIYDYIIFYNSYYNNSYILFKNYSRDLHKLEGVYSESNVFSLIDKIFEYYSDIYDRDTLYAEFIVNLDRYKDMNNMVKLKNKVINYKLLKG